MRRAGPPAQPILDPAAESGDAPRTRLRQRTLRERTLGNGVRIVAEELPGREGVSWELSLPIGAIHDPEDTPGATALLWEWQDRGAAGLGARQRREAFARLGVRGGGASGRDRSVVAGSGLADVLADGLALSVHEVTDPTLDDAELETARIHALEALDALEDRPADRLDEELTARAFVGPYARSALGTVQGLTSATPAAVRAHRDAVVGPAGATLVIVGGVDPEAALDLAEAVLGDWRGGASEGSSSASLGGLAGNAPRHPGPPRWADPARHTVPSDGEQTQLGWAWPLLPADDPRVAAQALGLAVLSGGMGARLFREVREARGLVYAVDAGARAVRGAAWGTAHAATTPERVEETIEVVQRELAKLADGVHEDELQRARTLLRTREAMQAESSSGRAGQLMRDLLLLGRPRSAGERLDALLRPTRADVDAALAAAPCRTPTLVVLGPEAA
ncbi:MAG: pitrilysin family protein [Trueperaceae bacterium]|nr:pitrilysin family protein [Trueperaceae bacterium]